MKLLAIDTSTPVASVAVVDDAGAVLAALEDDSGDHSSRLLPLIDRALTAASIELRELCAVAIGSGPGSFTGLRIGMATAKGLALGADKPLWVVSSLAAVAACATPPATVERIAVIADARRKEVFVGVFDRDGGARGPEQVMTPTAAADGLTRLGGGDSVFVTGDALSLYRERFHGLGIVDVEARRPSAVGVARCAWRGQRIDARAVATPVYIRPSEAEVRFPDGNPGGTFAPRPSTSK